MNTTEFKIIQVNIRKQIPANLNAVYVNRLMKFAAKHDTAILDISEEHWEMFLNLHLKKLLTESQFSFAPFTAACLGVSYDSKRVFYSNRHGYTDERRYPFFVSLIHELGHILASNKSPKYSDEVSFLGWEFLLMREIKAPMELWFEANDDYGIDFEYKFRGKDIYVSTIADIPKKYRAEFVENQIEELEPELCERGEIRCLR